MNARRRTSTALLFLLGLLAASLCDAARDAERVAKVRRNQRVLHQLRRLRQGGEDEQSASDERVRGALKNRLPSEVNLPKNVMPDLLEAASRKGTAQQPKEGTQAPAKGDGRQRNPIFNQQEQLLRHDGTTLPNGKPIVPEQPADIFIQELNAGDTGAFAARATNLLKRTPKQAQSTLTQAFAASLASATATSAQQAALTTAQAAAETFSLSGGSVSVASAFALSIVTTAEGGNIVAAAFALAIAISIGDFSFSLAISQAIVIGGCTPTLNRVLARAEALAIAQGNGGKFKSVAEATAVAQCLG